MFNDKVSKFFLLLFGLIITITVGQFFYRVISKVDNISPTENAIEHKLAKENEGFDSLHFDLVDPNQAPPEIHSLVTLGYQIMLHTSEYEKSYTNNHLNCTNCHFAGGITTGGKNGGISLAGIAAVYPTYNARYRKVIDLPTRINKCFENSLNGKAIPLDSENMLALVTYIHWISKDFPIYEDVPWRNLKKIDSAHIPDINNGKIIYSNRCALCHGDHGQGGDNSTKNLKEYIPPIWGSESFNKNAGMASLETLSAFIYQNMPYLDASLSEEEALDVAGFILSQPRE